MYFRVNLKISKPTLCFCLTWIVFIELNFTVAFLLIRTSWDGRFVSKVGNGGFQEIEGILVIVGGGVDTLLQTMIMLCASCCTSTKTVSTLRFVLIFSFYVSAGPIVFPWMQDC